MCSTQAPFTAFTMSSYQVWDYAGDNYVHRLIQSKTDGKLVEVPSPAETGVPPRGGYRGLRQPRGNCGEAALDGYRGEHQEGDGGYLGPEDDSLKEALIASKLDAIAQGRLTSLARPVSCSKSVWSMGAHKRPFLIQFFRSARSSRP